MNANALPVFVVVEGLDGVGKSTLVKRLSAELAAAPIQTPQAQLAPLRPMILQCFAGSPRATTLFYASTLVAAAAEVAAHRSAGRAVVLDRYFLSTCAYGQVLRAEQHPADLLSLLGAQLVPADLTVYLFADPSRRRERMAARGHLGAEDQLSTELQLATNLDAAYRSMSTHPLVGRWLPVDTSALTVDQTIAAICQEVPGSRFCPTTGSHRAPEGGVL